MSIELITKAIGDESRKKILDLLTVGELPASSIFDQFEYAAPTISRHLSVLKEAGLVHTRRDGVFIYYSLNKETFKLLDEWLEQFVPVKVKVKTEKSDRSSTPKIPKKENTFDKFQSEF
jgi:DNA-binding transcriptional ArsR family regulator